MAVTDELKKLLDDIDANTKGVDKLRAKIKQLDDVQLANLKTLAQTKAKAAEMTAAIDAQVAVNDILTDSLKEQRDEMQNIANSASTQIDQLQALNELKKVEIELLEDEIKRNPTLLAQNRQKIADAKKEIKQNDKLIKQQKNLKTSTDKLSKSIGGLLGGSAPSIDSMLNPDKIMQTVKDFKTLSEGVGGAGAAMKVLAASAAKTGLLVLAINTLKLSKELGDGENAFIRATNASNDFARNITNTYEEGRKFTASSKDMYAAATSLTKGFTDFTFQSDEAQRMIVTNTAALNKMGLSNQAVAKSLQVMTKSFGMTGKQGVKQLGNLEKFAENLQVPLEQLGADFQANAGDLAKLGDNGMEAFKGLAKAAKVTGLEMSKILNLTRQFDTFEGAARSAGKLNAALGGNFVNAMDLMMETDPAARLNQMRDAILDTGLSFDEMSYYQRNFYKDALGLGSVSDLAAVLSGDMESVGDETMKSSQELKELREQARATASFQEQLNAVFAQMIPILTPLIDGFSGLLKFISDNIGVIKLLGGTLLAVFGGIPGIVIAVIGLLDALKMGEERVSVLSALLEGFMYPISAIADVFTMLKEKIVEAVGGTDQFAAMTKKLIPIVKFLGGVLAIGLLIPLAKVIGVASAVTIGILAIGSSIAKLMGAFKKKNSPSFFDMFTGGLLVNSLEAVTKLFSKVKSGFEVMGEAVNSVTIKIVSLIAKMSEMKQAIANSFVGRMYTAGKEAVFGGPDEPQSGLSEDRFKADPRQQAMSESMREMKDNFNRATVSRASAQTAANNNISQTTANNTVINNTNNPNSNKPPEVVNKISLNIDGRPLKDFIEKTQGEFNRDSAGSYT